MKATTLNTSLVNDSYDDSQSRVKDTIVKLFTALKLRYENAKGQRETAKLNDHFLRDAGLARVETAAFSNSLFLTDPISQYVHQR